ncbi:arabinan endo-1,5-alpha-L-arabinosidase A [Histoplasma capsulatum H143]|uniref:Arabinan endo-1,5-alpha-L-arabinosidase A n=1 Tax=Ajellomyces capsulatus (strain H143) TaxID=544712 RepID=C6H5A8_AJECH|nr:arabinan endo-1,5-alpha-L-arabinosidase A [Histoplasma capsulatum H143]
MLKLRREYTATNSPLIVLVFLLFPLPLSLCQTAQLSSRAKTGNPIIEGWYADPELRIYEDAFYLYPTTSTSFNNQTFFDAFFSSDLLTWQRAGRILDFADVPWTTDRAAWAPTVGYKDGSYFLYYSAGDGVGIGVAVSKSPAGPFKDVLEAAARGELSVLGRRGHALWRVADDMVSFKGGFREVTPEKAYVEAPWMLKRKGVYYFFYSVGGWGDPSYAVKYVKGDSPLGPFSGPSKLILSSDPAIGTSTGHNSVFNVGDQYYIVYHRRPPGDGARDHRVVCIDRMYFTDNGEIEVVKITNEGVDGVTLK